MPIVPARPKGPPLNALRAFEAAARLGGFAKAAEELSVTPAAVAQQIKSLEGWSGAPLFERKSQGVRLTDLGREVFAEFKIAFDRLGEATLALRHRATPNHVRIAALPSVAQLWLSPRLPQVRAAMPALMISVTALETPPNLKREPYDIAIFFEELPVSKESVVISRDVIYPICAPDVAADLSKVEDLTGVSFVHDDSWRDDWNTWLAAAAPELEIATRGPSFSLYSMALEEARNGAGVLIGHDALVAHLLADGSLRAPFKKRIKQDRALTIRMADKSKSNVVLDALIESLSTA
jgi:LysR family transcriptional regulator, glycine cleavage system transcriptional activator